MFCGTAYTGHDAIVNDDEHAGRVPLSLDIDVSIGRNKHNPLSPCGLSQYASEFSHEFTHDAIAHVSSVSSSHSSNGLLDDAA